MYTTNMEVFKTLNDYENIDPNVVPIKLKGLDVMPVKDHSRQYSFSLRKIYEWNRLANNCVHASSVNMYNNRIDKYLHQISRCGLSVSHFNVNCHLRCCLNGNHVKSC